MINYGRWNKNDTVDGGSTLGNWLTDLKNTVANIGNIAKPVEGVVGDIQNLVKPAVTTPATPAVVVGQPTTDHVTTGASPAPKTAIPTAVWAVGGVGVIALLWAMLGKKR